MDNFWSPPLQPKLEGQRRHGLGESLLAANCLRLLGSGENSDMQFVLEGEEPGDVVVIPAHRVIVAARCEWFKRALLSGMKEAIDRYRHGFFVRS